MENHENCPAHSGMETTNKVIVWLLGILIVLITGIGGYQMKMLAELKVELAVSSQKYVDIKDDLKDIERRIIRLEGNGP